jgi:TPR repeat protein
MRPPQSSARPVLLALMALLPGMAPAVLPHVEAAARFTPVAPIRVAAASLSGGQPGTSNTTPTADAAQQRALAQLRSRAEGRGTLAQQREAQWTMGLLALHGIAMAQNGPQARQWFERAQRSGHPLASAGLAWCAIDGCGQPPDPPAARPWIAQLAQVDAPRARYLEWLLARRLAPLSTASPAGQEGTGDTPMPGTLPEQALLQRAAEAGSPGAQLEWGLALLARNQPEDALRQFRAAAPRSIHAAANAQMLGERMQATGQMPTEGMAAPTTAQQQWLQAQRYHRGEGVPANYTEAMRLYQQAAAGGHAGARRMLELIYSRPAPGGGVDIVWMQQLSRIDPLTLQAIAPAGPSPYRQDPTPLFDLLPAGWRPR